MAALDSFVKRSQFQITYLLEEVYTVFCFQLIRLQHTLPSLGFLKFEHAGSGEVADYIMVVGTL